MKKIIFSILAVAFVFFGVQDVSEASTDGTVTTNELPSVH